MSNEEMTLAIAKAHGFCFIERSPMGSLWGQRGINESYKTVPDYCYDLNAMHNAELTLTKDEFRDYVMELQTCVMGRFCPNQQWLDSAMPSSKLAIAATAEQRAEAFLRTKGLWKN